MGTEGTVGPFMLQYFQLWSITYVRGARRVMWARRATMAPNFCRVLCWGAAVISALREF